jgi:hypothetical protein
MAMCDYWLSCACDCKVTRKMNASDRPDCKENESDAFIVLLRVHCRSALGVCARSDGSQSLKESTLSVCFLLIGWDVRRMRVISYLFAYAIKSANWKFLDKFKYLYGTDWFQDDQSLPCVSGRYQRESLQVVWSGDGYIEQPLNSDRSRLMHVYSRSYCVHWKEQPV